MALRSLDELDKYKALEFQPGYPDNIRAFYSPGDQVHAALKALVDSATTSLVIAMYGFDDLELSELARSKMEAYHVYVQLSVDRAQASDASTQRILQRWKNGEAGNSIAIGTSPTGKIMHLKMVVIDGIDTVTGSTNWSEQGQTEQNNQLIVIRDPVVAAEARSQLDVIHDTMLKQMARAAMGKPRNAQGAGVAHDGPAATPVAPA